MFAATSRAASREQARELESFTWQEDVCVTRRRQRRARLRHLRMAVLLALVSASGLLITQSLLAGSVETRILPGAGTDGR